MSFTQYSPYPVVDLPDRQWPTKTITKAPIWCAVDLRDGNQALLNPMDIDRKSKMFTLLQNMGYKEIEIGFPSASQIDFDFTRKLVEENIAHDDVWLQVLTQSRDHLIERSFESLKGAKKAIIHLYNSTSVAQRRDVFKMSAQEVTDLACHGASMIKDIASQQPDTQWRFQYSPESWTGTELDVGLDVCNAILDIWEPSSDNKIIINLPSTVEHSTPNIFADRVEWMHRNLKYREHVILSLHTHNDRGTGIAASELGLLAGADRLEGTLLGNGERTGNADLINLGLNMYSQGIDPEINFSNLPEIVKVVEECNQMETDPRRPYAGELVFTALSGSHQDAIKKGIEAHKAEQRNFWDVPYMPINPSDIGRSYESAIRINSQSGKSGIAFILEQEYGLRMPKAMQINFSTHVQKVADATAKELSAADIRSIFDKTYITPERGYTLERFEFYPLGNDQDVECQVSLRGIAENDLIRFTARGNGPINAFANGLKDTLHTDFKLDIFEEYTMGTGSEANALSVISILDNKQIAHFGAGIHSDITRAGILSLLSAVNRMIT